MEAGAARTSLDPFWGVELAGWGYYLERTWREVADGLTATAVAFEHNGQAAILLSLELMVANAAFVERTRERIAAAIEIPQAAVMIACTHTHNAPACGGLRGVGETDPVYFDFASRQAATAAILAWRRRQPARTGYATRQVDGLQFNRTRENGPYDSTLTVLRVDRADGEPLAAVVNFAAHPTVEAELRPFAVSGDLPGRIRRGVESQLAPYCLYLQGACGDVNFHRRFQTEASRTEPADRLLEATKQMFPDAAADDDPAVISRSRPVALPTRRWTREELLEDRSEAFQRLNDNDFANWRETIGRAMTNRPDDMVARHGGDEAAAVRAMCRFQMEWTERMLADFEQRDETLTTEVQVIRVGRWACVSNASEFFSSYALRLREQLDAPLAIACYANGRIGYLPDPFDIERRGYASWQSPKYCDQFPFIPESAEVMTEAMAAAVHDARSMR